MEEVAIQRVSDIHPTFIIIQITSFLPEYHAEKDAGGLVPGHNPASGG